LYNITLISLSLSLSLSLSHSISHAQSSVVVNPICNLLNVFYFLSSDICCFCFLCVFNSGDFAIFRYANRSATLELNICELRFGTNWQWAIGPFYKIGWLFLNFLIIRQLFYVFRFFFFVMRCLLFVVSCHWYVTFRIFNFKTNSPFFFAFCVAGDSRTRNIFCLRFSAIFNLNLYHVQLVCVRLCSLCSFFFFSLLFCVLFSYNLNIHIYYVQFITTYYIGFRPFFGQFYVLLYKLFSIYFYSFKVASFFFFFFFV